MCFVDLEKAFDRVPRRVFQWAMRKRGTPEAMVRAGMSLYEGAKTRVRVGIELSEDFEVKVNVHQGSALSPLLFVIVVDVIRGSVRSGLMSEMLYGFDKRDDGGTEGEVLEMEGSIREQGAEGEPRED
ncbi:uncharacterized protein LOC122964639 [Acropora millepora]|uniref:uncharacterized protein LOC122964639 n=1 Tax=Acropora millepora TaxID=45264 RepID=UPI001CF40B50|nr:uncharacterized protein LOC122964639 [Acropora millepora]